MVFKSRIGSAITRRPITGRAARIPIMQRIALRESFMSSGERQDLKGKSVG